jgi:hypothetical protein
MEHFDFIKECLPELGYEICLAGNVLDFCATILWFIVLIPQLLYNFNRKSIDGLNIITAWIFYCISLLRTLWTFRIESSYFDVASSIFVNFSLSILLLQFAYYSKAKRIRKWLSFLAYLTGTTGLICIDIFLQPVAADVLDWAWAILCSALAFPQIIRNFKNDTADGQSYLCIYIACFATTCSFLSRVALLNDSIQPVIADFFLATNLLLNLGQILFFNARNNRRKKNLQYLTQENWQRFQKARKSSGDSYEDSSNYNSRYNSSRFVDYEDDEEIEQEEQRAFLINRSGESISDDDEDKPKPINMKKVKAIFSISVVVMIFLGFLMFVFAFLFSWKVFAVFGWYSQLAPLIMLVTASVIFMVYFCSPPEPEYDIVNN